MRSEEKLVIGFGFPPASGWSQRLPTPSRESRKIKPFESRVQQRGKAPMDTTGRSNCLIEGPPARGRMSRYMVGGRSTFDTAKSFPSGESDGSKAALGIN